ncbi:hypothetical protein BKA70DRAFT_297577 [Coprinopsis sp. MPI-PUGE-AT-0042]|nr:hypothetical protein BKA70DRAFT_297577 [Coprinopsis sp. MPI-PUGE-AT-0042]
MVSREGLAQATRLRLAAHAHGRLVGSSVLLISMSFPSPNCSRIPLVTALPMFTNITYTNYPPTQGHHSHSQRTQRPSSRPPQRWPRSPSTTLILRIPAHCSMAKCLSSTRHRSAQRSCVRQALRSLVWASQQCCSGWDKTRQGAAGTVAGHSSHLKVCQTHSIPPFALHGSKLGDSGGSMVEQLGVCFGKASRTTSHLSELEADMRNEQTVHLPTRASGPTPSVSSVITLLSYSIGLPFVHAQWPNSDPRTSSRWRTTTSTSHIRLAWRTLHYSIARHAISLQ